MISMPASLAIGVFGVKMPMPSRHISGSVPAAAVMKSALRHRLAASPAAPPACRTADADG